MSCTFAASKPHRPDDDLLDRLLEEVAVASQTPATELPMLAETVDGELLERLCQGADDTLTLSFRYHGCHVTVSGDGHVDVVRLDD